MKVFQIEELNMDDVEAVAEMIQKVFDSFNIEDCVSEGVKDFKNFIRPVDIRGRISTGSLILVARYQDELAGVIEIRKGNHIALLFTAAKFHRQGVAKQLLNSALAKWREKQPDVERITVNSSVYAVKIYEKLGFVCCDEEQQKYGMRFTPMEKIL